tara:strand:- start:759 stop:1157 length:399 start_codon:yes stop_codon:yes gene_type:complete
MTHTFFEKNDNFVVEETRKVDQFTVEISFADDTNQLELVFDPTEDYYSELVENLESGVWRHMICRVQAKYDDKLMGESYLASCVAEDPAKWIINEIDTVDSMVDEAVDEARNEAVRMLDILKKDFLGVDIAS